MAKAELGHKQRCGSCGIKFYDLNKTPIICPSCHTEFDPETLLKSRRGRSPDKVEQKVATPGAEETEEEEIITEADDDNFDDDDVLPTEDEPLIAIATDDDEEEAEGGTELIDVLDDEEPLVTGDNLDDEEEDS